jgi:hypothetical protein
LGSQAIFLNQTGSKNIGIGYQSLYNVKFNSNIGIGVRALYGASGGTGNIAIGENSLYNNINDYNIGLGTNSLFSKVDGSGNIAMGYDSLYGLTGGSGNVSIGHEAGYNLIEGNYNTFIGYNAGYGVTGTTNFSVGYTGNYLVCIGAKSYPSSEYIARPEITLGNMASNTVLRCGSDSIVTTSDSRDKTDIETLNIGTDFINQLKPRKYKWDRREWYGNENRDHSKKENKWSVGFIAQEFDEVQTNNNVEYLDLVYKSNPNKLEIKQGALIPILVKSVQELHEQMKELNNKVNSLTEENIKIKQLLNIN